MINRLKIEANFKPSLKDKAAEADNGMVATQMAEATDIGVDILKRGGNAVDAAVASALALGVCEPQSSGFGGQTMMLISQGNKTVAIDGSSRAPSLAHVNSIYKRDRSRGYRATTVPSTLATLYYVLKRYGTFSWQAVLEPAIYLAKHGITITSLQNQLQQNELENFLKIESFSGARYFLKKKRPYFAGEKFKQLDLAKMLEKISENGVEEFYTGSIAKQIDADMREHGGLLRYDDLALTPWPIVRRPLRRKFRNLDIYTMPPPAAGRTLLFTLLMLDLLPHDILKENENKKMHLLAEIFRKAFLERAGRPYDANFYPQITKEDKEMLRTGFARKALKSILKNVDKTIIASIASEDEVSGETTHLSIIDNKLMAVSLTQSIERVYGSKTAADGLGFLYNNYLMDFEYQLPSHPFYLRPNAVPWATVAPSLIFDDNNQIWIVFGSPGSERIFSTLTQFLINLLDSNFSLDQAMEAPRFHCSLGGRISLEADRVSPDLIDFLEKKGYRLDIRESFSFYLGCVQAVLRKQEGKGFQGVADIRRDGSARGF